MTSQAIIYEQPLNERIRTFLRLETLFEQTRHTLHGESPWDSRMTISSIVEIISLFERGDLKGEVIKELERHTATFHRLQAFPGVDESKLTQILQRLQSHADTLQKMVGKLGQRLKDIELIAMVRQRLTIPGGTCHFDIPMYHYWLQQPRPFRVKFLETWLAEFSPIEESVALLLKLIRESAEPANKQAVNGFYQQPLEPNNPCQLVIVSVNGHETLFPEISGSRHRISIRFLEAATETRPVQTTNTVDFALSCCVV